MTNNSVDSALTTSKASQIGAAGGALDPEDWMKQIIFSERSDVTSQRHVMTLLQHD